MKTVLHAQLQHMAEADVLAMVAPDTLDRIRRTDPHPVIRAYVVAHEGLASGSADGIGAVAIRYFQDAILAIARKLKAGTKIFHGHAATNDHEGRESIGEVVGREVSRENGVLRTVAAVYVRPEFQSQPLDVASIEAEVEFTHGTGGEFTAVDVRGLTGIALGNSRDEKPGFPGATLLAAIQAFAVEGEREPTMTRDELVAAVKAANLRPSEVFAADALKADQVVIDHVKAEKQTEYEHAKRVEQKLASEREDWQAKEAEAAKALGEARAAAVQSKTRGALESLVAERQFDPKMKAFVEKRFGTFKSEAQDEATLKTDLQRYLDSVQSEFKELAGVFGLKIDAAPQDKGAGPTNDGEGAVDLTDPKFNDFIPQPATV